LPTTADRLAALEQRVAANTALLEEIRDGLFGDGSKQSSLRERVTALEVAHTHETGLKYRAVNGGAVAVVGAFLSFVVHALTLATQH
jgi:hypothetical protein